MFSEDDLLPISALQHLAFCERQWGLIHIEQMWDENRLTAEGRQLHERSHESETEVRPGVRTARGLRLRSLRLGLSGQADVVEFQRVAEPVSEGQAKNRGQTAISPPEFGETTGELAREMVSVPGFLLAVRLEGVTGLWRPVPVEYKRGRPKQGHCDEVQLCAQALCLEETLGVSIASGALYYGKPRRRYEVAFDGPLRAETERLAARLHALTRTGKTPEGVYERKCESCSLLTQCMPRVTSGGRSAARYLARAVAEAASGEEK